MSIFIVFLYNTISTYIHIGLHMPPFLDKMPSTVHIAGVQLPFLRHFLYFETLLTPVTAAQLSVMFLAWTWYHVPLLMTV